MKTRRIVAGAATLAALAGGAAGAVAAGNDERSAERAVLADAAKRLGVTTDELRDALAAAQDEQLDAAVRAGRLTQEQADALKERRAAEGTVLDLGARHGHHGHRGGPGHGPGGPGGGIDDAVAEALGITERQLFDRLRDGRTLEQIARAEGKTPADVRAAVRTAVTERLDADVKAGRITQAQRDELLEHLGEHLERLGEDPLFGRGHHGGPRP